MRLAIFPPLSRGGSLGVHDGVVRRHERLERVHLVVVVVVGWLVGDRGFIPVVVIIVHPGEVLVLVESPARGSNPIRHSCARVAVVHACPRGGRALASLAHLRREIRGGILPGVVVVRDRLDLAGGGRRRRRLGGSPALGRCLLVLPIARRVVVVVAALALRARADVLLGSLGGLLGLQTFAHLARQLLFFPLRLCVGDIIGRCRLRCVLVPFALRFFGARAAPRALLRRHRSLGPFCLYPETLCLSGDDGGDGLRPAVFDPGGCVLLGAREFRVRALRTIGVAARRERAKDVRVAGWEA